MLRDWYLNNTCPLLTSDLCDGHLVALAACLHFEERKSRSWRCGNVDRARERLRRSGVLRLRTSLGHGADAHTRAPPVEPRSAADPHLEW